MIGAPPQGPPNLGAPTDDLAIGDEDVGPVVGRAADSISPVVPVAGFAFAAIVLFLVLNGSRTQRLDAHATGSGLEAQSVDWSPPPPLQLASTSVESGPSPFSGLPAQVAMPAAPIAPPPVAMPISSSGLRAASAADQLQRRRAPAVVVDLGGAPRDLVLAQAGPALAGAPGSAEGGPQTARPQLNDSEQFAKRVGEEEPERARAVPMRNPRAIAPQGTIIPGVLETAINSDLPGFTRAVVSRDVLSFDGKAVLIPKGSRLIGQYKSAVALGQSRAFIIWTRVIRPDGSSIQIGSPGTDELGRGGLKGEVNRHFFRRFSGSILLSVLNAGIASVGQTPSTQISIGSAGAATGLASSALQGDAIPPTIKVAPGEAINIFVARDLDFSAVGPSA